MVKYNKNADIEFSSSVSNEETWLISGVPSTEAMCVPCNPGKLDASNPCSFFWPADMWDRDVPVAVMPLQAMLALVPVGARSVLSGRCTTEHKRLHLHSPLAASGCLSATLRQAYMCPLSSLAQMWWLVPHCAGMLWDFFIISVPHESHRHEKCVSIYLKSGLDSLAPKCWLSINYCAAVI